MQFDPTRNYDYSGRRSVVLTPSAAVASSQPLATEAGLQILRKGGTAADAAVAVAAALQVTQPCSTGLGGDAFCLYYSAADKQVHAYNGSGRSPGGLTLSMAKEVAENGGLPNYHPYTVTVPGAADAWAAVQGRFGRLALSEVLEPAIRFAADGFPVAPMAAKWWAGGAERQLSAHEHGHELMIDGRAPYPGERFRNPTLATVLSDLGNQGRELFATGWVAQRIAEVMAAEGGVLGMDDLAAHHGEWVTPISVSYRGRRVWECPPNGQGLAALLALNTYQYLNPSDPLEAMHGKIEAMRLGFADAAAWVADPDIRPAPLEQLLSSDYARDRAAGIHLDARMQNAGSGIPGHIVGDDTVYFSAVDGEGNGCSFINSNFMGFGTGIVPRGCGFSLQNRGRGFVLEDGHPNVLEPNKRPYHTIIPGLMTNDDTGALEAVFGVMGGMMQPQGHLQVVTAMCDDGLDPQSALDAPRFQITDGAPDAELMVEATLDESILSGLRQRGHSVRTVDGLMRGHFGLGQIIAAGDDGVWWSGSDPRGDGNAGGF